MGNSTERTPSEMPPSPSGVRPVGARGRKGIEGGESRDLPSETRDSFSDRPGQGVPSSFSDGDPAKDLILSFETGDADLVYQKALNLASSYQRIERALASAQFKLNFGSQACFTCDGLVGAHPRTVGTCITLKVCRFRSVWREDLPVAPAFKGVGEEEEKDGHT